LAAQNVASAGELHVSKGKVEWLSNKSGHYQPDARHLLQVLHRLQKLMVPMTFQVEYWNRKVKTTHPNIASLLAALDLDNDYDYDLLRLMDYRDHLTDVVLNPLGMRWRDEMAGEKPGVYSLLTNTMIPHKEVRRFLKSQGMRASVHVEPGSER